MMMRLKIIIISALFLPPVYSLRAAPNFQHPDGHTKPTLLPVQYDDGEKKIKMSSLQSLSHGQQQNCSGCALFFITSIQYTSRDRHSENIKWKLIFRFAELSHYSPNSKPFIRHYHDCSTKCESPKSYFAYHSKIFHRQFCAVFCELC